MNLLRKSRKGRPGTLLAIGLLFFASGVIRLADGTGSAVAREVEQLVNGEAQPDASLDKPDWNRSAQVCESDASLNQTVAALRERSDALDQRERQIDLRAVSIERAEQTLQENLKALEQAEKALAATVSQADGAAEADIQRLISVYEQMKPKSAASIFEAMDPIFAAGFLARMRPDAAAVVMVNLSSNKAYSVSALLVGRNAGVPTE